MEDMSSLAERILDQITDGVIYADDTGTIRRWNQGAAALFGYSAAEALGQNLGLIIPEHLRTRHWRGFEAAMASGVMKLEGRPTLTRATHKSGGKLYVEMTFALIKGDVEDSALGSVAARRDGARRSATGGGAPRQQQMIGLATGSGRAACGEVASRPPRRSCSIRSIRTLRQ